MNEDSTYVQLRVVGDSILSNIKNGKLKWNNEEVQFFIPAILEICDFDWLSLIAENILIKEDEKIVKDFFEKCKVLSAHNGKLLEEEIKKSLYELFGE